MTNNDQAFGGIRGGQPRHFQIEMHECERRVETNHVHHRVNHY